MGLPPLTNNTAKTLDVEYYRNLEMWVRGHSRSLKLVSFESLGRGFLFAFYSNYGCICSRL